MSTPSEDQTLATWKKKCFGPRWQGGYEPTIYKTGIQQIFYLTTHTAHYVKDYVLAHRNRDGVERELIYGIESVADQPVAHCWSSTMGKLILIFKIVVSSHAMILMAPSPIFEILSFTPNTNE
jgi:hypothetical protein